MCYAPFVVPLPGTRIISMGSPFRHRSPILHRRSCSDGIQTFFCKRCVHNYDVCTQLSTVFPITLSRYSPGLIMNPCMSKQYGTLGLTSPKQEKTLHVIDKRQAASGRICSNIFRCGFRKMLSLSRQVDFRPGARQRFSVKCHEMTALRDLLGDVAGMSIGYLTHQRSHQLLE